MALTHLQLIASQGLLKNKGISANIETVGYVTAYQGQQWLANLKTAIYVANKANGNILSNSTITTLETLGTGVCPALADSPPYGNITYNVKGFTNAMANLANTYMGNNSVAKFVQAFHQAEIFINQTNDFIESANVGANNIGTFTNYNNLITGGITTICSDPVKLGNDFANLGNLLDLSDLENWGTPLALVKQLVNLVQVVPPPIQIAFAVVGIDPDTIEELIEPDVEVDERTQRTMFAALSNIRNDSLKQIMRLFGIKNLNGIETVADLLNPIKILPTSYQTLKVPTSQGFVPVYTGQTVNPTVKSSLPGYTIRQSDIGYNMTAANSTTNMTLAEYAYGNKAIAVALLQLNGVIDMTLSELADLLKNIQTTDMDLINDMKSPLDAETIEFFKSITPQGTGPGGTLVISDMFGTLAGYNFRFPMKDTLGNLANVDTKLLGNIYGSMNHAVQGGFGNEPIVVSSRWQLPGTYATVEAYVKELIPLAKTEISRIAGTQYEIAANLNNAWNTMGTQYLREVSLDDEANISFGTFRKRDRPGIMSMSRKLPDYGLDNTPGGYREFLAAIANKRTRPGQAIVACMTQGNNEYHLSRSGLFANLGIKFPYAKIK